MEKLFKKADSVIELLEKKFMPKTVQPAIPPMKPSITPQKLSSAPKPAQIANVPGVVNMPNMIKPPQIGTRPKSVFKPTKLPGVAQSQKKDPKKVAEQIREGTTRFNALEMLKFDHNGQWKLYPPEG